MDELVIPAARGDGVFRAAVTGCFVVIGLSVAVGGVVVATSNGGSAGGYALVAIGVLVTAVFAVPLAQTIGSLTGRLRLTSNGFEINKHTLVWSDIEGFDTVGGAETGAVSHLRVRCRADTKQSRALRASSALGRLGYYTAPAYIPVGAFDTGGAPLLDILRSWQHGDFTAGLRAADPPAAQPVRRRKRTGDEVVLARKRAAPAFNAAVAVVFFVSIAVGLPATLADDEGDVALWLVIPLTVLWLLLSAVTGIWLYFAVRELFSPGLILHDDGFELDGKVWPWADIEGFQTMLVPDGDGHNVVRLGVVYRAEAATGSSRAELPFSPSDFKTDGQPLEQILRERLQRHRRQG
ncbi:hypothetical protein [Mycolicibacterium stellerae]|uniref:hypothetical protein n=1 Tax=Mycolicibacterium stellerae TaxID=2358193 RepID=UPI0013DE1809|nr:hypothetical protein [Mycolicibacterium stellerae]